MGLLIGCAMVPVVVLLLSMVVVLFVLDPLWASVGAALFVVPFLLIVRTTRLELRDRRAR
jgi:hypothetical protein